MSSTNEMVDQKLFWWLALDQDKKGEGVNETAMKICQKQYHGNGPGT